MPVLREIWQTDGSPLLFMDLMVDWVIKRNRPAYIWKNVFNKAEEQEKSHEIHSMTFPEDTFHMYSSSFWEINNCLCVLHKELTFPSQAKQPKRNMARRFVLDVKFSTFFSMCTKKPIIFYFKNVVIFRKVWAERWIMGTVQKYSLKWNDFSLNVASTFGDLYTRHDFVDVTLACSDGSTLDAHKIILSSVSTYFCEILKVSINKIISFCTGD